MIDCSCLPREHIVAHVPRSCSLGLGNSLVVQWLGLHAFTAKGLTEFDPWSGTKIPQAARQGQKKKKKKEWGLGKNHPLATDLRRNHSSPDHPFFIYKVRERAR